MSDGFAVDIKALKNAGFGVFDLLAELDQHSVDDLAVDGDALGHDGLASSLASFCGRWQVGVENLTQDGTQLGHHLIDTAGAYIEADHQVASGLEQAGRGVDGGPGGG